MAWKLKEPPKQLTITHELAEEWSRLEPVGQDRPLSPQRVNGYETLFKAGKFRPVEWSKVYVLETQKWYRVNGKHTSTMFSAIPLREYPKAFATVSCFEADTLLDAAHLYSTFDSKRQIRSKSDTNRAYACLIPEFAAMSDRFVDLMVSGIHFHITPYTGAGPQASVSDDEKAARLHENIEFVVWAHSIIEPRNSMTMPLHRVPVVAAMRGSWLKAKAVSTEFWTAVRDETGPTPQSPDRQLTKWLMLHFSMNRGGMKSHEVKRLRADQREFYIRCIKAWNFYRAGETSKIIYGLNDKIPAFK